MYNNSSHLLNAQEHRRAEQSREWKRRLCHCHGGGPSGRLSAPLVDPHPHPHPHTSAEQRQSRGSNVPRREGQKRILHPPRVPYAVPCRVGSRRVVGNKIAHVRTMPKIRTVCTAPHAKLRSSLSSPPTNLFLSFPFLSFAAPPPLFSSTLLFFFVFALHVLKYTTRTGRRH